MAYCLKVENALKSFGDRTIFENISFVINSNDKTAIIAKNGVGKTTLLNILTGSDILDSGIIDINKDCKIGYLHQNPKFTIGNTVIKEVFQTETPISIAVRSYQKAVEDKDSLLVEKWANEIERLNAWNYEEEIKQILSILQIKDFNKNIELLSGGQQKRVALARVLISNPDLLILDEPTNHLDLEMIEWLEFFLKKWNKALLMVTHDRYFLDRICNSCIDLNPNSAFTYKGNYENFIEKREARINNEIAEISKSKNLYKTELEWMRRMPQARATKSKARIESFYKIEEKATTKTNNNSLEINIASSRLGKKIIEVKNINKSYDKLTLLKDFSYSFLPGEKIGIVGRNGCGKSTFINILSKDLLPDSGEIEIGQTIVFGYYKQQGMTLNDDMRVIDVIKEYSESIQIDNKKQLTPTQFLEYFLFPPNTHHTYVSKLSGGEKRRLYLMTVLIQNPNFLILDEPSNDLDIETLQVLENYLETFQGCVIVVSHDRCFLDKVVDHIFYFEGNGIIKDFPGNYSNLYDYLNEIKKKEKIEIKKESKETLNEKKNNYSNKLTYNLQREYDILEKEIPILENEKSQIEFKLNSENIEYETIISLSEKLNEINNLLETKSNRWLELAELKGE